MPNATLARIRSSGHGMWRTATWAAPLVIQAVFAVAIGVGWLLDHFPFDSNAGFRILILVTVAITTVASLLIGVRLVHAESPRRRGLGLALGGVGLAAAAGSLPYTLIVLPWMEGS